MSGKFRIDGVTGPDEYSAIADNNVFTNLMARHNLLNAADACERHIDKAHELGVDAEEMASWRDAAQSMYVPFDDYLGVHPQSAGFTRHEKWDFEATPANKYPLLLNYPYFDLYRKQVVKQADLVLAMLLCPDEFTPEQKLRNFDYYESITVRDSSLSACIQSIIAAEVGHVELAYDYLGEAAFVDLHDLAHNTHDGLHMASLAGVWLGVVEGFAVMRKHNGSLSFAPRLPSGITTIAFCLEVRERRIRVEIKHNETAYTLESGKPIDLVHYGKPFTLDGRQTIANPKLTAPPAPSQPANRAPASRVRPT